MSPHHPRPRKLSSAEKRLHDSLLEDFGDRMVSVRKAAELTGINIQRIEKAVRWGELRVASFGPKSRRILWSELHEWWEKHLSEKIAPI